MGGKLTRKPQTRRDAADAARLQKAGQHGDTVLAHINPDEARLLDYLADRKIDAPRNPKTGLLSFGMSDAEGPSGHDSNPGGVGGGPAGGNTGGGLGGNTEGGLGGLGGGYDGSTVDGYGNYSDPYGGMAGSIYSTPGIANMSLAQLDAITKAINDDIDANRGGLYGGRQNPRTDGWASPGTFSRLGQEMWNGPAYNEPGRFGAPNAIGPGIVGTMANMMTGGLLGGVMSLGGAMGRAGGVTTGPDSKNSGGNTRDSLGSQTPGSSSGAATAGLLNASRSPATQTLPGTAPGAVPGAAPATDPSLSLNDRSTWSGLPPLVQSLLLEYIRRGQSGSGW